VRVVVALGGNALLRRGESLDAATQRANIKVAAEAVAGVAAHHQVVLTHGNGPQVGLLALQNAAYPAVAPYPLDVLDAESEGMVGYLLEQELGRHLPRERLATLLTQVVVDPDDLAFTHPTKFVGPLYDETRAHALPRDRGWAMARDGEHWRRVVPSPEPVEIVELATIRLLADQGITVICSGGGGISVVGDGLGGLRGVEAVIDKDRAAELLARGLGADALLLLTDVDGVYEGFGTPAARRLDRVGVDRLRALDLPPGSMGPKADACGRFLEHGGRLAAIGALAEAEAVLAGTAGTTVTRP
jgi:carbamate kinase